MTTLRRLLILLSLASASAHAAGGTPISMADCMFRSIFHQIQATVNLTSLRQELKRVVRATDTEQFVQSLENRFGGEKRIGLRDAPPSDAQEFVTDTDYYPVFRGMRHSDGAVQNVYGGVIRVRKYQLVERGTPVTEAMKHRDSRISDDYSKIAEGPTDRIYAKLEFKIGHPKAEVDGMEVDAFGVVDKSTIVLPQSDIELLFRDYPTYQAHHAKVLENARKLFLTGRDGVKRAVNNPEELSTMIERIGKLHEAVGAGQPLRPVANIHYKRVARKIDLQGPEGEKYSVQLTVDQEIVFTDLSTGAVAKYQPHERVIELKLPAAFADQPPEVLRRLGHVELAELLQQYLNLRLAENSLPNEGKRRRGSRLNQ